MKCRHLTVLAVALACLAAGTASGQWMLDPPPADSSYWWTLTDGISPKELRATLQSRDDSRERLVRALENGEFPPVRDGRIPEISLFVDGARDPDLFPMWDVFRILANRITRHEDELQYRDSMALYGVSQAGRDQIVTAAERYWERRNRTNQELHPLRMKFAHEIMGPLEEKIGRKRATEIVKRRDIAHLAREAGMPRDRVSDLFVAWRRDVSAETATDALEDLKASLPESDWESFRRFLLGEIAPSVSYSYFDVRPLR